MITVQIQLKLNKYFKVLNAIYGVLKIKSNDDIYSHWKSSLNESYQIFLIEPTFAIEVKININENENLLRIYQISQ